MSSKKWFISLILITMVIVILAGALQFYLDPLLQYGGERGPLTYRTYTEIYCNPGIAKNYDYNSVLLGSSMVENTNVAELDELFNCKTIKVPFAGGSSYNHKKILDVCYDSGHQIDTVFWDLDEHALTTEKDTPAFPLPDYLYDDNKLNDLSYLLNLDVFYYYTLPDVTSTIKNQHQIMMRDGTWTDESKYCKENALSSISFPMKQYANKGEEYYKDNLTENINYNILPFVEQHPETEFNFFLVPYSMLFWYNEKSNGTLDAHLYDIRTAIGELLKFDNVKVHFFQDEKDIITDLNLYKDYNHYAPSINSWMSQEMKKQGHLLTKEDYNQKIDDFYKYLLSFDYDSFYEEQNVE